MLSQAGWLGLLCTFTQSKFNGPWWGDKSYGMEKEFFFYSKPFIHSLRFWIKNTFSWHYRENRWRNRERRELHQITLGLSWPWRFNVLIGSEYFAWWYFCLYRDSSKCVLVWLAGGWISILETRKKLNNGYTKQNIWAINGIAASSFSPPSASVLLELLKWGEKCWQ